MKSISSSSSREITPIPTKIYQSDEKESFNQVLMKNILLFILIFIFNCFIFNLFYLSKSYKFENPNKKIQHLSFLINDFCLKQHNFSIFSEFSFNMNSIFLFIIFIYLLYLFIFIQTNSFYKSVLLSFYFIFDNSTFLLLYNIPSLSILLILINLFLILIYYYFINNNIILRIFLIFFSIFLLILIFFIRIDSFFPLFILICIYLLNSIQTNYSPFSFLQLLNSLIYTIFGGIFCILILIIIIYFNYNLNLPKFILYFNKSYLFY